MDSKKDYKEDIIHVLAEAANYAALFNLKVEYLEAIDKDASWFSSTDIVENEDWKEIDVYVNLESFNNFLGEILHNLSLFERYIDFLKGIIDTGNIIFFVIFTLIWLFMATRILESDRWR